MTRADMQTEALVIESLLDAAMAMNAAQQQDGMFELIEMAHARANRLNSALDSVNAPEDMP